MRNRSENLLEYAAPPVYRASVAGSFVAASWGFTGLAAVAWKRWWGQR